MAQIYLTGQNTKAQLGQLGRAFGCRPSLENTSVSKIFIIASKIFLQF